ncbi:hypothetical protein SLS56_004291 [Neofusicoccum ribis]|uniref:Zn(2)-C6 fungal-type domain-containing protein n=1 Tax=Neofusicoccum ribis TaxID=45134 RepID=A0ABR3SWR5_9PEZI
MASQPQQPKRRRVVTACAECHRRKQKCDRKKPCNVCLARDVPDKCCYGDPAPEAGEPLPKSTGNQDEMGYSALEGATAFGDLKKLLEGDNFFRAATSNRNQTPYADEAEVKYLAFIKKIPPYAVLKELIEVYFVESNWSYPILERPFFNELFAQWTALNPATTRFTGPKGISRDLQYFAALIFGICASSCLEETLKQLWYDEHKRRIWVVLFIWNSFMAWVLGRPRAINLSDCDVRTPMDCNIPDDPSKKIPLATPALGDDDGPSFFSSTLVQYELSKKVHEMRELQLDKPYPRDYNAIWAFHKQILSIMDNAPPFARTDNPDTSFDKKFPLLPKKREQVTSVANGVIMVLHRPHMATHVESRKAAVQATLNTLDAQQRYFDLTDPHHYKLFGLTFYTIDAAIMLSAITLMYPPKDEDVKRRINGAMGQAISRLTVMSKSNPTASSGTQIVRTCYDKVKGILKPEEAGSSGTVTSAETPWSGNTLAESGSPEFTQDRQRGIVSNTSTGLDETLGLPDEDLTSLAFWDNAHTFDSSYWLNNMNQIPDLAPEDDPNNESTWDSLLL